MIHPGFGWRDGGVVEADAETGTLPCWPCVVCDTPIAVEYANDGPRSGRLCHADFYGDGRQTVACRKQAIIWTVRNTTIRHARIAKRQLSRTIAVSHKDTVVESPTAQQVRLPL